MKGQHSWRYNLVALGFVFAALMILTRLVAIQFSLEGRMLRDQGKIFQRAVHIYYPARGQIYDRNGNLLAGNRQVYEVGIDLYQVENAETIAFALTKVLSDQPGFDPTNFYNSVFAYASLQPWEANSTYREVSGYVTQEQLDQLKDWAQRYAEVEVSDRSKVNPPSLSGLVYRPRPQRYYPEGSLAASVLGFTNWEGVGVFGVEQKYNDFMSGEPQMLFVPVDPYRATELPEVKGGGDLILTIDRELQARVEQILAESLAQNGSESGTIVVMDPQSGEILAMASTPQIDLNHFYDFDEVVGGAVPFNRAVSQIYEPGSVFKIFTMAAALDSGAVTPETTFLDTGVIEIGGVYVYNWNYGAWGEQDMTGCLQHSLNVCLTWIAKQLGPTRFYEYMQRFNIGRATGVDIANETSGILRLPGSGDWYEADLGTNSFGQGVSVTPIQMLMAASAIANHGQMVMPHIMSAMVNEGRQYNSLHSVVDVPIQAKTAEILTQMLANSLEKEASNALVEGYRVAGKTGTAQIATETGYADNITNASFIGWGPVDDPKFMIYIWFEKPTSSPWGSEVAAPVFSEVFKQMALLSGLPPDTIRQQVYGH
jgi:cell division protein FtsI/penicillin-binding protein 2